MKTIDEIPGEGKLTDDPNWVRELIGKGDIDTAYQNGIKTGERRAAQAVADLESDNAKLRTYISRLAKMSDETSVELDEVSLLNSGLEYWSEVAKQEYKRDVDNLRAQLAQANGELVALREALGKVEWVPDGEGWTHCAWCDAWLEQAREHKPDCPRQLALSGERAAQLAALIVAAHGLATIVTGPITANSQAVEIIALKRLVDADADAFLGPGE